MFDPVPSDPEAPMAGLVTAVPPMLAAARLLLVISLDPAKPEAPIAGLVTPAATVVPLVVPFDPVKFVPPAGTNDAALLVGAETVEGPGAVMLGVALAVRDALGVAGAVIKLDVVVGLPKFENAEEEVKVPVPAIVPGIEEVPIPEIVAPLLRPVDGVKVVPKLVVVVPTGVGATTVGTEIPVLELAPNVFAFVAQANGSIAHDMLVFMVADCAIAGMPNRTPARIVVWRIDTGFIGTLRCGMTCGQRCGLASVSGRTPSECALSRQYHRRA